MSRAAAQAEAGRVARELDAVVARHQERVAEWEAAAQQEDARTAQRRAALEVYPIT